jgi:hypothetical protein
VTQVAEYLSSKSKVLSSNPSTAKKPYHHQQKTINKQKAGGVAQVEEYLPSRCEALNSNSSTAEKKKNFSRVSFLLIISSVKLLN